MGTSRPDRPWARPTATPLESRALVPDLARGMMLLLIALANAHLFLFGRPLGVRGYPLAEDPVDRAVTLAQLVLVDGRAYPLFALLFGYGIVQLAHRQAAAAHGEDATSRLVRRRGRWLMLIGFSHALLLFGGDIIGLYGLLAVVLAGLLIADTDAVLLQIGSLGLIFTAILGATTALPVPPGQTSLLPSLTETDPLAAAAMRAGEWLFGLTAALALVSAVVLGAWAARRRLLEEPERHRRLLGRLAAAGLTLAVIGGLPLALLTVGLWPGAPLPVLAVAGALHGVSGYAGGIGYAALIGLVAAARGNRTGPVTTALAACGQRSMTCYLLQSVVLVAVLAAYGGRLGGQLGVAAASAIGLTAWLFGVILADVMRRVGIRGPAETVLRALTYRTPPRGRGQ